MEKSTLIFVLLAGIVGLAEVSAWIRVIWTYRRRREYLNDLERVNARYFSGLERYAASAQGRLDRLTLATALNAGATQPPGEA